MSSADEGVAAAADAVTAVSHERFLARHGHGHNTPGEHRTHHPVTDSALPKHYEPHKERVSHEHAEEPWHARGLWQKPRLWRDWADIRKEDHRKISWSELFFDLIYVTVIARLGEALREDELSFGQYVLYFCSVQTRASLLA